MQLAGNMKSFLPILALYLEVFHHLLPHCITSMFYAKGYSFFSDTFSFPSLRLYPLKKQTAHTNMHADLSSGAISFHCSFLIALQTFYLC